MILKDDRLTKITAALLKYKIAYDFYLNENGEAGIRWQQNGKKYHVWQHRVNGPVYVSLNITARTAGGVSQTYIVKHIATRAEQER